MIHLYRCVFVCISHNVYERNSCFWFYMYATLICIHLNIHCYVFIKLLLLVCTIYVFTKSLYLCVIYHYVFIDLYIESRGLATIWCWCYMFSGLGSIPFFQFNSNSVIFNSNSGHFNSNSGEFKSNLNSRNDLFMSSSKFIMIIITRYMYTKLLLLIPSVSYPLLNDYNYMALVDPISIA